MPFAGQIKIGTPYSIKITTVNGNVSAATITVIRRDRIAEVDALSVPNGETKSRDETLANGVARLLVFVQVPMGGNTRVSVSNQGAPVFPDETINQDTTYALDAVP